MNPSTPESGYSAVPESVFKKVDKPVEDVKISCEKAIEENMVGESSTCES